MLFASIAIFAAVTTMLVLFFSVTLPTVVVVPLFSVTMPTAVISVLVRTFASVLGQTFVAAFLSVLVQTSVPAFGYTTASPLAFAQGLCLPFGNITMSLDPYVTTSPMILYTVLSPYL